MKIGMAKLITMLNNDHAPCEEDQCEVYENYSGRCMYGDTTHGVETNRGGPAPVLMRALTATLIYLDENPDCTLREFLFDQGLSVEEVDELETDLNRNGPDGVRQDSMGLGSILY